MTNRKPRAILGVLSCRIRATFLFLLGTLPVYVASFVLGIPYGERRLPLVRFRVRRSYNNRYPPYVLKIHPRSDLKPPAMIQNLPRLFSPLNFLFLAKPVCQIPVHITRGVSEIRIARQALVCSGFHWKQFMNRFKFIDSFKNFIFVGIIRAVFHTISLQILCLFIVGPHRQSVTKFFSTLD